MIDLPIVLPVRYTLHRRRKCIQRSVGKASLDAFTAAGNAFPNVFLTNYTFSDTFPKPSIGKGLRKCVSKGVVVVKNQ